MTYSDWKGQVADHFSAAASAYDSAARLQRQVAASLAVRVLSFDFPEQPRILEVGCGTGLFTEQLMARTDAKDWTLTDIAPAMVAACQERLGSTTDEGTPISYQIMDGENPDLDRHREGYDLIVSSLAMQWFEDLGEGITRLKALLRPGGRIIFSTLGVETFKEWRDAHAALQLTAATPKYPSLEQLYAALGPAASLEDEWRVIDHDNARHFLRELRTIGAQTAIKGHQPLSPGQLRRVMRQMEQDSATDGVQATYHVVYGCIQGK